MAGISELVAQIRESRKELASLTTQINNGAQHLAGAAAAVRTRKKVLEVEQTNLKGLLRASVRKEIPDYAKALSELCKVDLPFRVEILVNRYHTFKERILDPSDSDSTERLMRRHLWHIERSTCKTVSFEDRTADFFPLYRIHIDTMSLSPDILELKLGYFYILTQCTLEDAMPLPSAPSSEDAPRGYVIRQD